VAISTSFGPTKLLRFEVVTGDRRKSGSCAAARVLLSRPEVVDAAKHRTRLRVTTLRAINNRPERIEHRGVLPHRTFPVALGVRLRS
jgi:hypothetical protein